jgi:tetratricopeptide (TPR) repeat protein
MALFDEARELPTAAVRDEAGAPAAAALASARGLAGLLTGRWACSATSRPRSSLSPSVCASPRSLSATGLAGTRASQGLRWLAQGKHDEALALRARLLELPKHALTAVADLNHALAQLALGHKAKAVAELEDAVGERPHMRLASAKAALS